jgi:hypothetical protein
MVRRRHNALGFAIQLPKFVQNPAEDLESEVCAYLANINICTNHCVLTILLWSLSGKSPGSPGSPPAHAHVCRRVVCEARGPPRRGAGSHHARGRRQGCDTCSQGGFVNIFRVSVNCRRCRAKKQQGAGRPRRRLHTGGRVGRRRRVSAA